MRQTKQTPEQHQKSQAKYQSTPKQKKIRASRNRARAQLEKEGLVHKGDGKDVDHKNSNPLDGKRSNLRVRSRAKNRSLERTKTGREKRR